MKTARPRMSGLSFAHRPVLSALRASRTQGSSCRTHLPTNPFGEGETAGVNGSQVGFVLWSTDRIEDISNFI